MKETLKALLAKWTEEATKDRRLGPSTVSDTLDRCCRELREALGSEDEDMSPGPICPCGAEYNFTCYCERKEIDAFRAGREWEAEHAQARLDSVGRAMATWPGDWSEDRTHAWIYGVVLGWDDDSLSELEEDFGWHSEDVKRLISLMPKDRNE